MSKRTAAVNCKLKVMQFFWIATTPPMQMTKYCQIEPPPEELSKYKSNQIEENNFLASISLAFCHYRQIWAV